MGRVLLGTALLDASASFRNGRFGIRRSKRCAMGGSKSALATNRAGLLEAIAT
jgi:hypothetical protein